MSLRSDDLAKRKADPSENDAVLFMQIIIEALLELSNVELTAETLDRGCFELCSKRRGTCALSLH
jgi:hypothetical protein